MMMTIINRTGLPKLWKNGLVRVQVLKKNVQTVLVLPLVVGTETVRLWVRLFRKNVGFVVRLCGSALTIMNYKKKTLY